MPGIVDESENKGQGMTPTARTLVYLRRQGYLVEVVERWIQFGKPSPGKKNGVRRDCFGIADLLACRPRDKAIILIQATSAANISHRVKKSLASPHLATWLDSGGQFQVWGWAKRARRWEPRITEISGADLLPVVVVEKKRRRGNRACQGSLFG